MRKVTFRLRNSTSLRRSSKASTVPDVVEEQECNGTTRKSSVSELPEEILLEILHLVHDTSDQASFAACLFCCRRWHRIGLPLLYSDAVLIAGTRLGHETVIHSPKHDKTLLGQRVHAFVTAVSTQREFIRSVTLRTASCNIDWPKWRPLHWLDKRRRGSREHWFDRLCQTLSSTPPPGLTIFSLKVDDTGPRVHWTPQGKLIDLIGVLPPTIIHLELDTMGADFATAGPAAHTEPSHVCAALAPLVPRLHTLRLRLRFLCEALFDSVQSHTGEEAKGARDGRGSSSKPCTLRAAALVFAPQPHTPGSSSSLLHTQPCRRTELPQHGEAFGRLAKCCRELCAAGGATSALPRMEHLRLIARAENAFDSCWYVVYDPVADMTWFSDQEQVVPVDPLDPTAESSTATHSRFNEPYVDGEAGWVETSWLSRRPALQ